MPKKPLTGPQARQGRLGRPVLVVLVASLVLVAIYVVGLMLWVASDTVQQSTTEPNRPAASTGTGGQGQ